MGHANHFCSRALGRAGQESDRPQTCGLRARLPDCLSTHRFAGFDGQQSGRECIFLRKCKHLLPKNTRNAVHAVISDKNLFFRGFVNTLEAAGKGRIPSSAFVFGLWQFGERD